MSRDEAGIELRPMLMSPITDAFIQVVHIGPNGESGIHWPVYRQTNRLDNIIRPVVSGAYAKGFIDLA